MSKGLIAIYGNRRLQPYLEQLTLLLQGLSDKGYRLVVAPKLWEFLGANHVELPRGIEKCEEMETLEELPVMALSIGGDGTFLSTARWLKMSEVPILGLNAGHLGFMATFSMDEPVKVIDAVTRGLLYEETRSLLEISGEDIGENVWRYALNEVSILRSDNASMINARTYVDGFFLGEYVADGLIVSTPTGSTGYNLSVGGPILQPTLNAMVLSPIAPHTMTLRPVVVTLESEIVVETSTRAPRYRVSLDGWSFALPSGSRITIRKAPFSVKVLKRATENFADVLRHKLLWGQR